MALAFNSDMNIDSGILGRLREEGKSIIPTDFNADQLKQTATPAVQGTVGGTLPVFKDGTGKDYVIDEKNIVYEVDPRKDTGIAAGTGFVANGTTPIRTAGGGLALPLPPTTTFGTLGGGGTVAGGGGIILPPGAGIGSGKLFSVFTADDIVPNQQETVTRALWTGGVGTLTTFFTSSAQTAAQKEYYLEIYNSASISSCNSEPQFSVAYGNRFGSGSVDQGGQIEDTPSRAIYGQYRLLCLDSTDEAFIFNGQTANSIYVINVNRARMLESLDEGNVELNLAHLSGSQYIALSGSNTYTGSVIGLSGDGNVLRLIDDSKINPATIKQSGEVYNIVSGTIEDGIYNSESPIIYGQLFKRKGVIVLNGDMLDVSASFGTAQARELDGDNARRLFISISGSSKYNDGSGDPLGFQGRGSEKVKSTHYFVRVKNSDYNFSNNPTFVTGSEGDLRHGDMYGDPKTYITTIGLYNTNKDLVAVAKLSQAIKKSYKEEALIKVKLDF
jgi:hypothetical protein